MEPLGEDDLAAPEEPPPAGCGCVLACLEELAPSRAEVLRRVTIEEEPVREVAEALGLSANNVMVRHHRAREALRVRLVACCGAKDRRGLADCACDRG